MLATWFGEAASTIDAWFDAPNSRCGGPPFKTLAPPVELKIVPFGTPRGRANELDSAT